VVLPTNEEQPVCDQCDLSGPDDLVQRVQGAIARRGFGIVSVMGSARSPEFSYTVGLTEQGLPELVVLAVRPAEAVRLLDVWADYLREKSVVLPGETLESGPWLLEAVAVERPEEHLLVAHHLYGERLRALQLVWADDAGRWPWDPAHRAQRAGQPLLGARAPWYCEEHSPNRLDVPPHL
jgi:hypothetical protein